MKIHHSKAIAWAAVTLFAMGLSWHSIGQTGTNGAFLELKKQQERLTLENNIAQQQLQKDLAALTAEKQRLELENGIAEQELRQDMAKLTAEKQRLELENSLAQQKLQAENAGLQAQLDKLGKETDLAAKRAALQDAERRARLDGELADARQRLEKMKLTNELAAAEIAEKNQEMAQREQELKLRAADLQAQRADLDLKVAKLNSDIDLRAKRDLWRNRVNRDIQYTQEPLKDGVLTISDRRVPLNGPIWSDTADFVQERIDYFNNQSHDYPIFIVIDESPGGSVMAGYKILKAMDGSAAPVYVVVKSFAASMAANIVTQSKKSFAYPNAIILHHQISAYGIGNLTEQKEQVKEMEDWWKRLAAPVAAKMGISLDEFIRRMYKNRSTGDWQEFGDSACKLKWVDQIVDTIREDSYYKNPDAPSALNDAPAPGYVNHQPVLAERTDANGQRYVLLPRLSPMDCYYLYNPDNYYRLSP